MAHGERQLATSRPSVDRFTHLPRHAHPAPQSTRHAPVHTLLLRPSCLCHRCYARGRCVGRASSRGAEVDGRRPKKGPMGSGARALPRTPAPLATARQSNVPPGPPCPVDGLVDAKSDPGSARAGWRDIARRAAPEKNGAGASFQVASRPRAPALFFTGPAAPREHQRAPTDAHPHALSLSLSFFFHRTQAARRTRPVRPGRRSPSWVKPTSRAR